MFERIGAVAVFCQDRIDKKISISIWATEDNQSLNKEAEILKSFCTPIIGKQTVFGIIEDYQVSTVISKLKILHLNDFIKKC